MENIWRRSGEWVTVLKSDLFTWARIKLTLLYLLIITVILAIFSAVLFYNLRGHIKHDFDRNLPPSFLVNPYSPQNQSQMRDRESVIEDAVERIGSDIITVDLLVFIISAILSYLLAGYTLKPIAEALEAQKAFSADASHELRTPLTVMRNDIEVLLRSKKNLDPQIREILQSNIEEIESMSEMTVDLLELARNQKHLPLEFQKFRISELIYRNIEKFKAVAAEKNIQIHSEKIENLEFTGNKYEIDRIIKNLLANAIVYTDRGDITISLYRENTKIVFCIEDTGVGISDKDLPYIFERFYKADASRTGGKKTGSGLGLAIVKQIVERHKGKIEVSSIVNKGTKFYVYLPLM